MKGNAPGPVASWLVMVNENERMEWATDPRRRPAAKILAVKGGGVSLTDWTIKTWIDPGAWDRAWVLRFADTATTREAAGRVMAEMSASPWLFSERNPPRRNALTGDYEALSLADFEPHLERHPGRRRDLALRSFAANAWKARTPPEIAHATKAVHAAKRKFRKTMPGAEGAIWHDLNRLEIALSERPGEEPKKKPKRNPPLLPLGPRDHKWDAGEARKRLRKWATNPKTGAINYKKYGRGFLYGGPGASHKLTAYKLPIADVYDTGSGEKLYALPHAIEAVAAVLDGARGGVDIPKTAKAKARGIVARYYKKMGAVAPWKRGKARRNPSKTLRGFAKKRGKK